MATTREEHLQELSKGYRFDWKDADHRLRAEAGSTPAVVERSRP